MYEKVNSCDLSVNLIFFLWYFSLKQEIPKSSKCLIKTIVLQFLLLIKTKIKLTFICELLAFPKIRGVSIVFLKVLKNSKEASAFTIQVSLKPPCARGKTR